MIDQFNSKEDKRYRQMHGYTPYDSGNVYDAHERIDRLEEKVAEQAKLIDALYVALATNENVPRPRCIHSEVKSSCFDGGGNIPARFGECTECFGDVATWTK